MNKILIAACVYLVISAGIFGWLYFRPFNLINPISKSIPVAKPLDKYALNTLRDRTFRPASISIQKELKKADGFISYLYVMDQEGKKVSGQINIPDQPGTYPVIVMFRGFVDRSVYTTGEGTRRTSEELARNGFITIAPDFLGYGASDVSSENGFEDRFLTYYTAITTLASVENMTDLKQFQAHSIIPDITQIGIWGHSNGGHIALVTLEVTGSSYPTVLWAPVSKPFPYSILYFTDEFDDHGKSLRKSLAIFEENYDVEAYSPSNFYGWIHAPIQIHQGEEDEAVPAKWSQNLERDLKEKEKDVELFLYPKENHNFNAAGTWSTAVTRSVEFYKKSFLNSK